MQSLIEFSDVLTVLEFFLETLLQICVSKIILVSHMVVFYLLSEVSSRILLLLNQGLFLFVSSVHKHLVLLKFGPNFPSFLANFVEHPNFRLLNVNHPCVTLNLFCQSVQAVSELSVLFEFAELQLVLRLKFLVLELLKFLDHGFLLLPGVLSSD